MVEEKTETEKKNAATEEIKEEREATEEPEKPRKSRMDGIQRQAFLLTINNPQKYDMEHEKNKTKSGDEFSDFKILLHGG